MEITSTHRESHPNTHRKGPLPSVAVWPIRLDADYVLWLCIIIHFCFGQCQSSWKYCYVPRIWERTVSFSSELKMTLPNKECIDQPRIPSFLRRAGVSPLTNRCGGSINKDAQTKCDCNIVALNDTSMDHGRAHLMRYRICRQSKHKTTGLYDNRWLSRIFWDPTNSGSDSQFLEWISTLVQQEAHTYLKLSTKYFNERGSFVCSNGLRDDRLRIATRGPPDPT